MFIILGGEAINVLGIFLARETLGADEAQYGLLSAVMTLGLVAGSLAAGATKTENLRLMVFLGSVTAASVVLITAIVMGLTRALSIGALGLGGLLGSLFDPRTGFVLCGAVTMVVSLVIAAVVLVSKPVLDAPVQPGVPEDGVREDLDASADRQQEAVQDQVPDILQQQTDAPFGAGVIPAK